MSTLERMGGNQNMGGLEGPRSMNMGGLDGPPMPPALGDVPAKPGRPSISQYGPAALAVAAAALAVVVAVSAQAQTHRVGRAATTEEITAWDIAIGPDGKELPAGQGTAASGKKVYMEKCAECHGATGKEGPQDVLVGGKGTLNTDKPLKTIGSYWPYATTIWDFTYRTMPFTKPGSLTADETYAVTA